jgi:hypothetical protein
MTGSPQEFAAEGNEQWLTAVLRPAGVLAGAAIDRFIDSLTALAENANLVVVDFAATTVPAPDTLAAALRRPGELLSAPDRCLLLAGADPALLRALDRCGGQIATVDADPAEIAMLGPEVVRPFSR